MFYFIVDAGNLIPYEYAIALAENAVDNGVELRIRREVVKIETQPDGDFVLTANYWEPKTFIDFAGVPLDSMASATSENFMQKYGFYLATALAAVSLLTNKVAKNSGITPQVAQLLSKIASASGSMTIAALIISAVYMFAAKKVGSNKQQSVKTSPASAVDIPSVGTGGRPVTVDEMR